jgi:hypothetical protein
MLGCAEKRLAQPTPLRRPVRRPPPSLRLVAAAEEDSGHKKTPAGYNSSRGLEKAPGDDRLWHGNPHYHGR